MWGIAFGTEILELREGKPAYALVTLPRLMQLVQTRMRLPAPLTRACTA